MDLDRGSRHPDDTSLLYSVAVGCNLCRTNWGLPKDLGFVSQCVRSADKSRLCTMPMPNSNMQCQSINHGPRTVKKSWNQKTGEGSKSRSDITGLLDLLAFLITAVMRKRSRSPPITCPTQLPHERRTTTRPKKKKRQSHHINPTSTWPPVREEKKKGCIQQPRKL